MGHPGNPERKGAYGRHATNRKGRVKMKAKWWAYRAKTKVQVGLGKRNIYVNKFSEA